MEQRLTIITLGVKDFSKMRSFYEKTFGWEPNNTGSDDIIFYQLNGIQLALFDRQALAEDAGVNNEGAGFKGFSLAHNLHSEEEVDQLFDTLKSRDANIVKPPQSTPWGGYSGYINDPEDNLWEIAYNPFLKFDDAGNVTAIKSL